MALKHNFDVIFNKKYPQNSQALMLIVSDF